MGDTPNLILKTYEETDALNLMGIFNDNMNEIDNQLVSANNLTNQYYSELSGDMLNKVNYNPTFTDLVARVAALENANTLKTFYTGIQQLNDPVLAKTLGTVKCDAYMTGGMNYCLAFITVTITAAITTASDPYASATIPYADIHMGAASGGTRNYAFEEVQVLGGNLTIEINNSNSGLAILASGYGIRIPASQSKSRCYVVGYPYSS